LLNPHDAKPFATNLWVSMEDDGARTSGSEAFSRSLVDAIAEISRPWVAHCGRVKPCRPYQI